MNNDPFQDKELSEQLKKLTLERLGTLPKNTEVAIGSEPYSKEDLIDHVGAADDLGRQIMIMELEFLQDLASGEVYKDDSSYNPTAV